MAWAGVTIAGGGASLSVADVGGAVAAAVPSAAGEDSGTGNGGAGTTPSAGWVEAGTLGITPTGAGGVIALGITFDEGYVDDGDEMNRSSGRLTSAGSDGRRELRASVGASAGFI